ncbi:TerB family tellurite resistance protein [Brevibacillus massiliensis]|jgi:uncharacterized tellurite resistance protein B-like protein|uniref:tellurite resistance TerB family protein n=1 Tax=Brevibacillus massiliensis TaxID=1118054 RepID=UPI0002F496DF|nr:TerB family tellurite resistance protein [Brevibacillus massiliensis]
MMTVRTEQEKLLLLTSIRLMICVGHADGYMGEQEIARIYEMVNSRFTLRERQILIDDFDEPKTPEQILSNMQAMTNTEKLTLLRQLYRIALADNRLSSAEQKTIHRIAALLGIGSDKLQQVEDWMLEGLYWKERWKQIVGE